MDIQLMRIFIYLTTVIWLITPFRQYKTQLFWYFLVICLPDVFTLTLARFTQIASTFFLPLSCVLLIPALYQFIKPKKLFYAIFIILLGLGVYATLNAWMFALEYFLIVHSIVLIIFIQNIVASAGRTGKLNIFFIITILYELTLLLKILGMVKDFLQGASTSYLTSVFEIFIAIFFIIYRMDNPKLLIELRKTGAFNKDY